MARSNERTNPSVTSTSWRKQCSRTVVPDFARRTSQTTFRWSATYVMPVPAPYVLGRSSTEPNLPIPSPPLRESTKRRAAASILEKKSRRTYPTRPCCFRPETAIFRRVVPSLLVAMRRWRRQNPQNPLQQRRRRSGPAMKQLTRHPYQSTSKHDVRCICLYYRSRSHGQLSFYENLGHARRELVAPAQRVHE